MRLAHYDDDRPPILSGETTSEVAGVVLPSASTALRMSDQQRQTKVEEIIAAALTLSDGESKDLSAMVSAALRLLPLPEGLVDQLASLARKAKGQNGSGRVVRTGKVSNKRATK